MHTIINRGDIVIVEMRASWGANNEDDTLHVEPLSPGFGAGFYVSLEHVLRVKPAFKVGDRVTIGEVLAVGRGWVLVDLENGEWPEVFHPDELTREPSPKASAVEQAEAEQMEAA